MKVHQSCAAPNLVIRVGNSLHCVRRWFYAIPLVILIANAPHLDYLSFGGFGDGTVRATAMAIVLSGLLLRFWTSGSTARTVTKKDGVHFRFCDSGIYSVLRNPYFTADFLIVLGLSMLLMLPPLILISLGTFLALSLPILWARESALHMLYPEAYEEYRAKVGNVFPSFVRFKSSGTRFRWRAAMEKEGNILGAAGLLVIFMEQFRRVTLSGDMNPLWAVAALAFLFFCLVLGAFDRTELAD